MGRSSRFAPAPLFLSPCNRYPPFTSDSLYSASFNALLIALEIPFITTHEEGSKECQEVDNLEFGKIEKSNEDNPFSQLAALKEQLKQNK